MFKAVSASRHICVTLILAIGLATSAAARPPDNRQIPAPAALTVDNTTYIDANYIFMFVTNHGNFGRDLGTVYGSDFGTYYPYLSTEILDSGGAVLSPLYASGLSLGGVDSTSGDTLVTVSHFSSEYVPGPMAGGTFQTDRPEFRVYKLHRDSLGNNPNQDYLDWPVDQGAPVDGEGNPAMRGDQMLWTVFNDADPGQHTNHAGETAPLGIEVQMSVWAFGDQHPLSIPMIDVEHVGPGEGTVSVLPVRPNLLTGHDYAVVFEPDPSTQRTPVLVDRTLGTSVTASSHGLHLIVSDANTLGVKPGDMYLDPGDPDRWGWDVPNGTLRFTWEQANGYGWEGFRGALGWAGPGDTHGYGWYDPVPHDSLPRVLLKLAPTDSAGSFDAEHENVSYAYRYLRGALSSPARPEFEPYIVNPGSGYRFQAFEKSCPLSAWRVDVDPPQRLAVGYLENNAEFASLDGKYWPLSVDSLTAMGVTNTSSGGPREWLWIYLDEYHETPKSEYSGDAIDDPMPIMYWATWARPSYSTAFADGDEFLIIPSEGYSLTPADTFNFTTPASLPVPEDPEDVSLYIQYKLLNKGDRVLKDVFASLWSDPDLGTAGDDLGGCDTIENRWFCYNETDNDRNYGAPVPAVGFKLLEGPVVPSSGDTATVDGLPLADHKNLGLSSYYAFVNNDPDHYWQWYACMWGRRYYTHDTPPLTYNGDTVRHLFSGDPVTGTGWLDFAGDDRRMFASFGPFDLRPGDTQQVLIKFAVGEGTDYLNSITRLREILEYNPYPTGINDGGTASLPNEFSVEQNYPNPFNPSTTVEYSLPTRAEVEIVIFNILGRRVTTLKEGVQSAGEHTVVWNGVDDSGKAVATGVYFYRVRAGNNVSTKKMLLLK